LRKALAVEIKGYIAYWYLRSFGGIRAFNGAKSAVEHAAIRAALIPLTGASELP